MDNPDQIQKQAKRAAYIVAAATFIGFSWLFFEPHIYGGGMMVLWLGAAILQLPVAFLLTCAIWWLIYFIFRRSLKKSSIHISTIVILAISGLILGFGSSFGLLSLTLGTRTPPYTNEQDTNRDGKIDKWFYDHGLSTIIKIDDDYDGKPDIREHYKNGELIKKERISDTQVK